MSGASTLTVKRVIRASPEALFDAWITPHMLRRWWGPEGVHCSEAEVDARPGGRYRIANAFSDGRIVWISGEFETVQRPDLLVFSWSLEGDRHPRERVSVSFNALPGTDGTEVSVFHERVPSRLVRDEHEAGWQGCLDGLEKMFL
jgi:uncharacterized protein YndB with AHSA1/START domain